MSKIKTYEGIMTLGLGHSIMLGNKPPVVTQDFIAEKQFEASKVSESISSFGLFGSDLNYNTYYPDAKPEDFTPQSDEFIEPVFRLLSECIVSKWYPTDFGVGNVLKDSLSLLVGQTVNCDHETSVGNAIGSIKSTFWQESYKADGVTIPAGINGVLLIDAKANPRIARGINMNPPAIHSNSVTVMFEWVKSHPELSDDDFWDKMGTYDKDGNLIKRNVSKIIKYMETSLVSHGADPFAKKIGFDGKIVNTKDARAYSFSEENGHSTFYFGDFKDLVAKPSGTDSLHNTMELINEREIRTNQSNNKNDNKMELEQFLSSLFGDDLLTLKEGDVVSAETVVSALKALKAENVSLAEQLAGQNGNEEVTRLQGEIEANRPMVTLGTEALSALRSSVIADFTKLQADAPDESMLAILKEADYKTLTAFSKTYKAQLDEKFPPTCGACGSHEISRASAQVTSSHGEGTQGGQGTTKTAAEVALEMARRKNRG